MNAIILAAGMGTRLRPLTDDRPKCMVEVNGTPMVERQIQYLHESGITDITLVSGYQAACLDFLKEKYGVKIVFNDKYAVYNNIYSMYLVRDRLNDTFVLEGDVFMNKNCLVPQEQSTYFARWIEGYQREWGLIVDEHNRLEEIRPGDGTGYIMSGISYWTSADASKIVNRMEELVREGSFKDLFWDNAVLDIHHELNIRVERFDDFFEIDTVAELRAVEKLLLTE